MVSDITSELIDSIQADSIKDCVCLGKHNEQRRSRPILVKFNRFADVSNILSKRKDLDSHFLIKPVMSPDERKTESILKERWNLTQSGVPKKDQDLKFLHLCQTTSWDSQKFSISAYYCFNGTYK